MFEPDIIISLITGLFGAVVEACEGLDFGTDPETAGPMAALGWTTPARSAPGERWQPASPAELAATRAELDRAWDMYETSFR